MKDKPFQKLFKKHKSLTKDELPFCEALSCLLMRLELQNICPILLETSDTFVWQWTVYTGFCINAKWAVKLLPIYIFFTFLPDDFPNKVNLIDPIEKES